MVLSKVGKHLDRELQFKNNLLTIHWNEFLEQDYLPKKWFKALGSERKGIFEKAFHFCGQPGDGPPCYCDVSVFPVSDDGKFRCEIDYTAYAEENKLAGYYLGISTLIFRKPSSKSLRLTAKRWEYRRNNKKYDGRTIVDFDDESDFFNFSEDESGSPEGRAKYALHLSRERNATLRNLKLKSSSVICCEVCNFNFEKRYQPKIGARYIEVHHLKELKLGDTISKLENLALLCANCHRMIHRALRVENKSKMSIAYFKSNYLS
jgi:hypothetical protein